MRTLPIAAEALSQGDVLIMPWSKTATIKTVPEVEGEFVVFTTEHGETQVRVGQEVYVKVQAL